MISTPKKSNLTVHRGDKRDIYLKQKKGKLFGEVQVKRNQASFKDISNLVSSSATSIPASSAPQVLAS
jgi:hypothetical protein